MVIFDDQGLIIFGVVLNYVGRDDGILLRVLSLFVLLVLKVKVIVVIVGYGVVILFFFEVFEVQEVRVFEKISFLCGIVDSDFDFEFIQIEVINDKEFLEGWFVEVKLRDVDVIYQVIDGVI